MSLPEHHFLFRAVLSVPCAYPALQRTADANSQLGMTAQNFLVNRHRPDPRRRSQQWYNLCIENIGQRVRAAPAAWGILLRWQSWVGLQPIPRCLTDAGLGGSHGC